MSAPIPRFNHVALTLPADALNEAGREALLVADRYLLVKIYLHIGKEEQRRRLETLSKAPDAS